LDALKESIRTADLTSPKALNFCLVDGGSNDDTIRGLREYINTIKDRNIRVCESKYRTTCQEAWNLGIGLSEGEYVLFTSSDCFFQRGGWFDVFVDGFNKGLEYILIGNHALFGISKSLVYKIGWFDENFKHGAHVDVDFMIRSSEIGVNVHGKDNHGFYKHGDYEHGDIESEYNLEIENPYNENYFKSKWQTSWKGLGPPTNYSHPPTHISLVKRKLEEIDPYPIKRQLYKG